MRRYAEGTTVTVEKSRGDITGILAQHGVQRMGWFTEPGREVLQFELDGHAYRLTIPKLTAEELRQQWIRDGKPASTTKWLPNDNQVAAELRRRWRATVLLLKAKLEFAEGDASTVVRELMAYTVMKDGRTLEEAILEGDSIPLLAAGS